MEGIDNLGKLLYACKHNTLTKSTLTLLLGHCIEGNYSSKMLVKKSSSKIATFGLVKGVEVKFLPHLMLQLIRKLSAIQEYNRMSIKGKRRSLNADDKMGNVSLN